MKGWNLNRVDTPIDKNYAVLSKDGLKLILRMIGFGVMVLAVSLISLTTERAVAQINDNNSSGLPALENTLYAIPISQSGVMYQLTYSKWDGSAHNLYMADTNGQNERLVFTHAAGPSWSPDSKRLFFYGEPGIDQQIRENRVACSFGTISDGIVAVDLPSPLSDICQVQPGAWTCERKSVDLAAEPSDVCTANGISVYQNLDWKEGTARWASTSPNGEAVAFDAKPGGDTYRIYFRAMLGTSQQFRYELLGEQGSWAPDGQRMVYRSGRDNKTGLWISNRDDSGHTLLTNDGSDSFPAWSPDGRTIAFSRQVGGNIDIYTINVDGSNLRRLTDVPGHDTLPTYTPSGDIIFRSDRTGSWGIWKMGGSGAGQVEIIPNAGVGPDWAFSRVAVNPRALYAPPPPATATPIPVVLTSTLLITSPASLSGTIVDQETGQPVPDVRIGVGVITTTTDAKGQYHLDNVPPDRYVLSAVSDNHDPGLSAILTLSAGQTVSTDLALFAPGTSPYPQDPMRINPLDPNGAPTREDAERLAREQGLTGQVVNIGETKVQGRFLVNYKRQGVVRAAVAEINHEAWELTDEGGRRWWIIKACGNLASPLPEQVIVATPAPRPFPPLAQVVEPFKLRSCASETCAEVGAVELGMQVEVFGCLADGSWCDVGGSGVRGWCAGRSLRHLAVAAAVPVVEMPATIPGAAAIGEKIAFVSDQDGNDEIYVMNVDGSGLIRLTNHPDDDRYPAWSPDGQWLAFSREGVYVMRPDGAGQTRLTDFGGCPAWSPDGRHIAFSHSSQLYVMNSDGSELTRLGSNINCPTWLPDGKHIAYFLAGTWVLRIDTNGHVRIVDGNGPTSSALDLDNRLGYIRSEASMPDANYATWSLDGRQIVFQSFGRDRDFELYTANSDGSGLTRLTNQPGADTSPTWSPDGRRIAFTSEREGNEEIYVMNADGSGVLRLTEHPANDRHPAWSPVGVEIKVPAGEAAIAPTITPAVASAEQGKIVFACSMNDYRINDDGSFVTHPADGSKIYDPKMEICVINSDGSGLTRLTYHSHRNYARGPAWSSDKQRIAFSDDNDIYVMNADGSGLTPLTNSPDRYDTSPTWSPDGQKLAFCSNVTSGSLKPGIFVMNSDGSGLTQLMDHQCFNPEWSPDGSKIALDGIDVINADGSNLVQLTSPGNSPNWSADGQKILFTRGGTPSSEFFIINADGTGLTLLATHQATEYWPNWSPDGQRIVFHSNRHGTGSTFDLYIMNADGSEVTRLTEIQELNGGVTKLVNASDPDW